MALSGLHVACGYAGGRGPGGQGNFPLLGSVIWSQTMVAPGTTSNAAPDASFEIGNVIMSIRSSQDAWIAISASPDASAGPRRFLAANTDLDLFVKAGDRLAWTGA